MTRIFFVLFALSALAACDYDAGYSASGSGATSSSGY